MPLAFLTYLNVVFQYGYEAFTARCDELDIRGLVIPDMPYEERGEIVPFAEKHNIDLIPLITPTSADRIEKSPRPLPALSTWFLPSALPANGVNSPRTWVP